MVLQLLLLKYDSIKAYLFGVRAILMEHGVAVDFSKFFLLKSVLRGYKRVRAVHSLPKLPFTPALLRKVWPLVDYSVWNNKVMMAAVVLAIAGLFRAGELTSRSPGGGSYFLPRSAVSFTPEGILCISLPASKTDVFREGVVVHIPPSPHGICPVALVKALLAVDAPPTAPLFRLSSGRPLSYAKFNAFISSLVSLLGLDRSRYSSHSCRRGGAQALHDLGVPSYVIQLLGRWLSQCFMTYIGLSTHDVLSFSSKIMSAPDCPLLAKRRA